MKSENILKVINNFKKVSNVSLIDRIKGKKKILNMSESRVNEGHRCGTVHCHGGWYAVAACDLKKPLTYLDGAIQMAMDLGFKTVGNKGPICHLNNWAHDNRKIWGNDHGFGMFGNEMAFESKKRPDGAQNIQHIIDHWTEVYKRVKAAELLEAKALEAKKAKLLSDPPVDTLINDALKTNVKSKRKLVYE